MPDMRWAAIPPGRRTRWLIPRSPRVARSGLAVFQPMTMGARVGWEFARLLAGTGAFYLLPTRGESELADMVRPLVRAENSLAISLTRDGRRGVVLVLGHENRLISAIKVALDPDGQRRLALEADWLTRANRLLEAPLSVPRVLDSSESTLVLEPVAWVPRWRPWHLPVVLARGIGRLHAALGGGGHGDFAPWNVMRTRQGWTLLDWEEATAESPAYADPFHYLIQAHALLGRPRKDEVLRGLEGRGWVGAALEAYASVGYLTDVDRREALVHYLQRSMPDDLSRPDHVQGFKARQRLLKLMGE